MRSVHACILLLKVKLVCHWAFYSRFHGVVATAQTIETFAVSKYKSPTVHTGCAVLPKRSQRYRPKNTLEYVAKWKGFSICFFLSRSWNHQAFRKLLVRKVILLMTKLTVLPPVEYWSVCIITSTFVVFNVPEFSVVFLCWSRGWWRQFPCNFVDCLVLRFRYEEEHEDGEADHQNEEHKERILSCPGLQATYIQNY